MRDRRGMASVNPANSVPRLGIAHFLALTRTTSSRYEHANERAARVSFGATIRSGP